MRRRASGNYRRLPKAGDLVLTEGFIILLMIAGLERTYSDSRVLFP